VPEPCRAPRVRIGAFGGGAGPLGGVDASTVRPGIARVARSVTSMERIELLYFDGCPSWHDAWSALGTVLAEMGCDVPVRLRDVTRMDPEELDGFAGSPTIRVDGADLFGYRGPMLMACRRYEEDGGQGWPSVG